MNKQLEELERIVRTLSSSIQQRSLPIPFVEVPPERYEAAREAAISAGLAVFLSPRRCETMDEWERAVERDEQPRSRKERPERCSDDRVGPPASRQ